MTFYWIYDLSNWSLCTLILGAFLSVSLAGLFISRPAVRWFLKASTKHNDIVSYFFAGIGIFYGLALGLIAVATWDDYTQIDAVVTSEAAAVSGLYRDLDGYPQPFRDRLERIMREYTRVVIDREWPAHKRGLALEDGDALLDHLENEVMSFEPATEREKIVQSEVVRTLDLVTEQRRLRLQAVTTGLPAALWAVVLGGALLNVAVSYLFWIENVGLHAALVAIMATFIGLLVFLTAAMDNPFRGEFSVSSQALQTIFDNVMCHGSS
jgi:hypothetical protein